MSISPSCIWPGLQCDGRVFLFLREDPDVVRLVDGEVGALGEHKGTGANQYTDDPSRVDNIKSAKGGTDPTYLLARMKRDAPEVAQDYLDWLKVKAPDEAVGFEAAVTGGRKLGRVGNPTGSNQHKKVETLQSNNSMERGNRSDYILARLERDRPDILNEFPTAWEHHLKNG